MKLKLYHLAGYLPYELKYKDIPDGFEGIRELNLFSIDWCLVNGKPILRPLSDLTKEIEVNGEKFVPKNWLGYNYIGENLGTNMATWSHRTVQKLYEWHFDIHGLISTGLAIDINTLNKT